MFERAERHLVGVRLPDHVDVAHRQVDGHAGQQALRQVHEDPVSHLDGVVEPQNRDACAARAG